MEKIKNIEKILDKFPDWSPTDLAFIISLNWSQNNLIINFLSQTRVRENNIGWPSLSKEFVEISITFIDVERLNLSFGGLGFHQVTGFNINDISSYHWENINFEIEDYESSTIGFYCKDINLNSVSSPRLFF